MEKSPRHRVAIKATVKTDFGSFFIGDISSSGVLLKIPSDHPQLPAQLDVEIKGEQSSVKETLTPRWSKSGVFRWVGCQTFGNLESFIKLELEAQKSVPLLDKRLFGAEEFLNQQVEKVELLDEEKEAIDDFCRIVGKRSRFLWRWGVVALNRFAFPARSDSARLAQFYLFMLNTTLDDIADGPGEPEVTKLACDFVVNNTPFHPKLEIHKNELIFARSLFLRIREPLLAKKCTKFFWPIVDFDIQQMRNNFIYSAVLATTDNFNSPPENQAMQHHNMSMMTFVMLELAHRDRIPEDLNQIRELTMLGSKMGRIGNTVSTWLRELNERDFSSLFFVLTAGKENRPLTSLKEIPLPKLKNLCENNGVRELMLEEWLGLRFQAQKVAKHVTSFDGHKYVESLEDFLKLQMGAVGRK